MRKMQALALVWKWGFLGAMGPAALAVGAAVDDGAPRGQVEIDPSEGLGGGLRRCRLAIAGEQFEAGIGHLLVEAPGDQAHAGHDEQAHADDESLECGHDSGPVFPA